MILSNPHPAVLAMLGLACTCKHKTEEPEPVETDSPEPEPVQTDEPEPVETEAPTETETAEPGLH